MANRDDAKAQPVRRADIAAEADTKQAPKQHVPAWLPEGTREELERTGKAVNPFTGEQLTKGDK